MKIVHFIPVYAPAWHFGGPVLSVSRLCEALADAGHDVSVITTNAGLPNMHSNSIGKPVLRHGVKVTYYQIDYRRGIIYSRALEEELPKILKDSDVLHISSIWQPLGIPVQKTAYKLGIPIIQSPRGALGPYSWKVGWWKKIPYYYLRERTWLQKASGLHVTSLQERKEILNLGLSPRLFELPNPIDLSYLSIDENQRKKFRVEHNIKQDIPVLLICGRQHHKKGLDLLTLALNKLSNLEWKILLVGNDDDGSGRRFVGKIKNKDRLIQLPNQEASKLRAIYNAADLLLLPSRHENFGNVVIEAMACGCTTLVSDRTGVGCDLLRAAPANFGAVLPRNSQAWETWLTNWLQQPMRAGNDCAQWARQTYGSAAIAEKAVEMYRQILDSDYS